MLDPLLEAHERLSVPIGIVQVSPKKPFWLFLTILAANERFLPKDMVIAFATKSPLSLT